MEQTKPEGSGDADAVGRFGLLASAICGRSLQVAPVEPGEQAWTDGATVFVDTAADAGDQLTALAVQASLLAAGSLHADIVRKIKRRPALAPRYLTIEGHRALAANEEVLPPPLRSLIDRHIASRAGSPDASLAVARSREAVPDPPAGFGTIRARNLLRAMKSAEKSESTGEHVPRREKGKPLEDIEDDEADDVEDPYSSPVGGGARSGSCSDG